MVLLYAFIQPSFFGVIAGGRGEKKKGTSGNVHINTSTVYTNTA